MGLHLRPSHRVEQDPEIAAQQAGVFRSTGSLSDLEIRFIVLLCAEQRMEEMCARFVNIDHDNPLPLPPDLRDWVSADHMVHFIMDAFKALKTPQITQLDLF